MARANRHYIPGYVWHLTHRCHKREFLLKFSKDKGRMLAYEEHLKETIQSGKRKQDSLNPRKYRYVKSFDDLVEDNTHIVAIVIFGFSESTSGEPVPNNYIVTAYQKEIG